MHIKRIAIIGFKSYRDQLFEEPFSPKHNVVVGRNGSGKSNFFNAILFVLSEKYAQLHPNDRRELLHAAAGAPVLSAYVEVTFDNSDGRLVIPGHTEEAEVSIRRTIGVQKDEFRVNDRAMSAKDVRQLLEGAGFSAANPYYVVEQGRIVHITNMSEAERLSLVKEVAGTKVYESRRNESIEILEDTQAKRARIDEAFTKLASQRIEAENESAECAKLRDLETTMRTIEYCLHTHEASKVQKEIDAKASASRPDKSVDALYEKKSSLEDVIQKSEEEVHSQKQQVDTLDRERKKLDEDRLLLTTKRSRNDVLRNTAMRKMHSVDSEKAKLSVERETLQKEVEQMQSDVAEKTASLSQSQSKLESATADQSAFEANVMRMQTRRGNQHLFKSAKERNTWLAEEIARNSEIAETNKRSVAELTEAAQSLHSQLKAESKHTATAQQIIVDSEQKMQSNEATRLEAIRSRDTLQGNRRTLFQNVDASERAVKEEQEILKRTNAAMDKAIGSRDIRDGLRSLDAMLSELKQTNRALFSAVHGPVIDLFTCDDAFYTAVEVTAGNALFNIIVDKATDCTALLKFMNERRMPGRLTILALDNCKAMQTDIPETNETTPLLKHLQYDAKYAKVFQSIFGSTVVAETIEVAASVSSALHCAAVTLDGDQINKKGGLRGGFLNRMSRLSLHDGVRERSEAYRRAMDEVHAHKQALAEIELKITAATSTIESCESTNASLRKESHTASLDVQSSHAKAVQLERTLSRTRESISATKAAAERANETVRVLTAENSTDFKAGFSDKDESALERERTSLRDIRTSIALQTAEVAKRTTELEVLRDTIAQSTARLDLIGAQLSTWMGSGLAVDTERCAIEDKALDGQLSIIASKLKNIDAEISALCKSKQRAELTLHEKRQEAAELTRKYDKALEARTKAQSTQFLLDNQLEEIYIKMRQTGVADAEASEYKALSSRRLVEEAKKCAAAMDALGHVNRRAVDQLVTIQERMHDLGEKRTSNDKELESINDMIRKLDEQKDEAIERTVKQVQHHFETVFRELVPVTGASASLVLMQSDTAGASGVESYAGIRIQVCFGIGQPTIELAQLSGGQRSLVALALIFAIQRCDPAPFYLFDEIDAALDISYRTAVADMIRRQSEKTQFITATFKEEMLAAADKVYGIFNRNRVSRVQEISMDDGRELLRQEALRVAEGGTPARH